jgi:hypothetical protein
MLPVLLPSVLPSLLLLLLLLGGVGMVLVCGCCLPLLHLVLGKGLGQGLRLGNDLMGAGERQTGGQAVLPVMYTCVKGEHGMWQGLGLGDGLMNKGDGTTGKQAGR